MNKSIAVFGLERFGGTFVKEFAELGIDVLVVENNAARNSCLTFTR